MTYQRYNEIKNSTSKFDLLYKYFLESGGARINTIQFMGYFNKWCSRNNWEYHSVVEQIIERLDKKHGGQGFTDNWK